MRRFSQRNSLVTLSDINITPLLDLAFVLLIIFMITVPLLEQSVDLNLPAGGKPAQKEIDKNDVRRVDINARGQYRLGGERMSLPRLESELRRDYRANPKLIVHISADKKADWDYVAKVLDVCSRNGITQISPRFGRE